MAKIRKIEERKKLQEMIDKKEYSDDPIVNRKIYDLYLEKVKDQAIRNDENDLIASHLFDVPMNSNNYNPSGPGQRRYLAETEG